MSITDAELDLWIAQHIVGFQSVTQDQSEPKYTTNRNAVWAVVDAMEKRGQFLQLRSRGSGVWLAYFGERPEMWVDGVDPPPVGEQEIGAPRAICAAARAALCRAQ